MIEPHYSVYNLNYHLVLATKCCAEVIDDDICNSLHDMFSHIEKNYGDSVQESNHDMYHDHVLFSAKPITQLVAFINSYKSATSRVIKKEFPRVRNNPWEEKFWSKSHYIATTGGTNLYSIEKYIKNQGKR